MKTKKLNNRISKITVLCLVFFAAIVLTSHSQDITIRLMPMPVDQFTINDVWKTEITNTSMKDQDVRLHAIVNEDRKGLLFDGTSASFTVMAGYMGPVDIEALEPASISHIDKTTEDYCKATGSLPPGTYIACVYVLDAATGIELSKDCLQFESQIYGPPQPLTPINGTSLNSHELPLFSWTPTTPPINGMVYTVRLVELLPSQAKEAAINTNPSVFEMMNIDGLELQYPPDALELEPGKSYAWQVTAGLENGERISFSEVSAFSVAKGSGLLTIKLLTPEDGTILCSDDPETDEPLQCSFAKTKFSWTVPGLEDGKQFIYTLMICKVGEGQTAEQAMDENNPVYSHDVDGAEFSEPEDIVFLTPEYDPLSDQPVVPGEESKYAWQVSIKDKDGNVMGNGSAIYTVVVVFTSEDEDEDLSVKRPVLVAPADNETIKVINTGQEVELRWKMPPEKPDSKFTYYIKAVLVRQGQGPEEAILNNDPIIDKGGIAGTEFGVMRMDVSTFNSTDWYIPGDENHDKRTTWKVSWQVIMVGDNGQPVGMPSIISSFFVLK
ncbi:MAG: hypothetical protein RBS55_07205 [Bacteroidales bacterium]|jgi:hypothetical protein|nr:hypothetical protein [Bacteroidales bacterium]